ncbi:MAG: outer membrane lipoprotein carrier protein LolA [Candidatus Omnitrophica bacterium]|nr:outer membrane lipoprotein carrier protein LolA [Candidatus Omnitrophota bacterium]
MRNGWVIAVFAVVLGMGLATGEAAALSASYDQKITQGPKVMTAKVLLKDELFRMETAAEGQVAIILRNREGTFAMKIAVLHPGQQPIRGAAEYGEYLAERQAERIGAETVGGYACDIYRFTDPEAGGTVTAWVWKDKMFPVRFEIDGSDGKMLVELSNLQLGANIPDTAFQLPAGVQVMDMGGLMSMQ